MITMKQKVLFFNVLLIHLYALGIIYLVPEKESEKEFRSLVLASTTSLQDSGVLDLIVGQFEKKTGTKMKAVAVGSGQAFQMGRMGEADVLIVHSPPDEERFVDEGYGIERVPIMYNEYVILGPGCDPAGITGFFCPLKAMAEIALKKTLFVSRGDESGTHKKEVSLWNDSGVFPQKELYIETGQGMSATMYMASEKKGYCIADLTTYLAMRHVLDLKILNSGNHRLLNQYSLIVVNPEKVKGVNVAGAKEFLDYLLSSETKDLIETYDRETYGQLTLFMNNE